MKSIIAVLLPACILSASALPLRGIIQVDDVISSWTLIHPQADGRTPGGEEEMHLSLSQDPPSQESRESENRSRLDPLQKSLLIPGWGQLAEKHIFEGALFLSAELACLYGFWDNNRRGNKAYALYQSAQDPATAVHQRQRTERYDIRRNRFLLAAAAVWTLNLVDIYVIVKKKETKERALSLRLQGGPAQTVALVVSCRL